MDHRTIWACTPPHSVRSINRLIVTLLSWLTNNPMGSVHTERQSDARDTPAPERPPGAEGNDSAAGGLPAHVSPGPAGLRHGFWRQGLSHCRDKLCLILPPLPAPLPLQSSPFPICRKAVNGGETAENLHGNYRGFMSPSNPVGSWAICRALAAS